MDARDVIKIGMSAERSLIVPAERTVGHFVPGMPMVYATPMMILEMEMASADAVAPCLEPGWVTVGTEVDIRHLAATPVGAVVRTVAPTGVAARWRMSTSVPTVTQPGSRQFLMASPETSSISRIIIGVAKTIGMP